MGVTNIPQLFNILLNMNPIKKKININTPRGVQVVSVHVILVRCSEEVVCCCSIQTVGRGNQARTLTSFFRLLKNILC